MTSGSESGFDIVVFGATGFTGERVAQYLHDLVQKRSDGFTMSIAGRNFPKLKELKARRNLSSADIICADVNDYDSLLNMASMAKLIINCVGPYLLYGEPVVRACVESGTHYVDFSGEVEFIEEMELKYHLKAHENHCFVVSACGFGSIPADIGCMFVSDALKEKGATVVSSIESYITLNSSNSIGVHYGTYASAIHGFGSANRLGQIRQDLKAIHSGKIQTVGACPKRSGAPKFDNKLCLWTLPFMGADAPVVLRSFQTRADASENPLPFYNAFMAYRNTSTVIGLSILGVIFSILALFSFGRTILLKFPRLFTFGLVSHAGPSQEIIDSASFTMRFFGKGYSSLSKSEPDMEVEAVVSGPEAGYVTTPITVVQAALVILEEQDRLHERKGGVLTPASALRGSSIVQRLHQNGVKFELIQ